MADFLKMKKSDGKIRWKNQKSMLGINGLDASDFLKEVLITLEDKIYFLLQEFGQKTI